MPKEYSHPDVIINSVVKLFSHFYCYLQFILCCELIPIAFIEVIQSYIRHLVDDEGIS